MLREEGVKVVPLKWRSIQVIWGGRRKKVGALKQAPAKTIAAMLHYHLVIKKLLHQGRGTSIMEIKCKIRGSLISNL
jgi:hypothetical protein